MLRLKHVFGSEGSVRLSVYFHRSYGANLVWTEDLDRPALAQWMIGDEEETVREFVNKSYKFLANGKQVHFEVTDSVNAEPYQVALSLADQQVFFSLTEPADHKGTVSLSRQEFRNIVKSIELFYIDEDLAIG